MSERRAPSERRAAAQPAIAPQAPGPKRSPERAGRELTPCTSCARHVRATEPSCPFCASPVQAPSRRVRVIVRRATRLAILSGAVMLGACGSSHTADASVDAGVDAGLIAPYGTPSMPDAIA